MAVQVRIPAQLRNLTNGEGEISISNEGSLDQILAQLFAQYPNLSDRVLGEDGKIRRFVNVFVADEDIRFLEGLETKVLAGQVVSIVPAVAGG